MNTAIEFDFATRTCRTLPADSARRPDGAEAFIWVDLDLAASPPLADIASRLGFEPAVTTYLDGGEVEPATVVDPVELFDLTGADGVPVRCAMSERALLSVHRGEAAWLRAAVVPETTQPHLRALAERLDRLADELAVQREALNDAVQMHLGALAQRANLVMQRLTVVGTIFLPLTFLTGIYGMNMHIPEAQWPGMYAAFWVISLVITGGLLVLMRRWRWW